VTIAVVDGVELTFPMLAKESGKGKTTNQKKGLAFFQ
jgi:hypothetical protein